MLTQELDLKVSIKGTSSTVRTAIKCVPGCSVAPVTGLSGSSSHPSTVTCSGSTSVVKRSRFYFESDTLALKSNPE